MIDRRTFIQGAALVATTPALVALRPLSSEAQSRSSLLTTSVPPVRGDGADGNLVVFKIDGWDYFDPKGSTGNTVLIKINQSWRAAWR